MTPIAGSLRIAGAVVLLLIATRITATALRADQTATTATQQSIGGTYLALLGMTAANPTTVVYFTALIIGHREQIESSLDRVAFAVGTFAASAGWQLILVAGGSTLGHAFVGARSRQITALIASAVIAMLAIRQLSG